MVAYTRALVDRIASPDLGRATLVTPGNRLKEHGNSGANIDPVADPGIAATVWS